MDIVNEVISILEIEGYSTRLISENKLIFEDESLCGFISVQDTIQTILETWETIQNDFVKEKTNHLREDISKAFNLYSIFLTSDNIQKYKPQIINIQEDFKSSRKIVGYGINTTQDIKRILLPLISIQKKSSIETSNFLDKIKSNLNNKDIISDKSIDEIFNKLV